jgi:hypothetical protein
MRRMTNRTTRLHWPRKAPHPSTESHDLLCGWSPRPRPITEIEDFVTCVKCRTRLEAKEKDRRRCDG